MAIVVILLIVIGCYYVDGYLQLLYWCLLVVIILTTINGYSINGYWLLFY